MSAPATEPQISAYVECLCREILAYRKFSYQADTVFFGGGTPSLLSGDGIKRLMEALHTVFIIEKEAEITIECNPETVDGEKLALIRQAGVNRISFGLQSASDRELALLGRIHSYDRFLQAYQAAREAGFQNINVDLMSAIPGQSMQSWEETLGKVIDVRPQHISAYSLIIEEGTDFYDRRKELALPDEETERSMYYRTRELLRTAGYERYEISNYALPGMESRHNLKYWSGAEYIGMGLGASSYLEGVRFHNPSVMKEYLAECASLPALRRDEERLDKKRQMEEFCFLGLRKCSGISEAEFLERFGQPIGEVYQQALPELIRQGLLRQNDGRIALTDWGIDVSNQVLAEFLLD